MLPPGQPIEPLSVGEAAALFRSSAAGQARRVRGVRRLRSSVLACPLLHSGWVWLLTPGAAAVHTLLCAPPVTAAGARGGQSADQLAGRLAGGLVVGLGWHDDVAAEVAEHATPEQAQALSALRAAEHDVLDPAQLALILAQLDALGLAVHDGGRWWCAASRIAAPSGGARPVPPVPLSAPWRHAAGLAAEALLVCWLRRTDRYSLPAWDLLDPQGPDAHRRAALFDGGPEAAGHFGPMVEAAAATATRVNALTAPLVTLVPSELDLYVDGDSDGTREAPGPAQADRPAPPALVELSLTFRVQFGRAHAARLLGEAERDTLAASGVATCDAATAAAQMVPAVLSVVPVAWRPAVQAHARRLEGRGLLAAALEQRSLAEFAADAGLPVHQDVRASAALALRSEPVGYTSAASVLHECSDDVGHRTPFGIAELADDSTASSRAWVALYEQVLGSTEQMAAVGRASSAPTPPTGPVPSPFGLRAAAAAPPAGTPDDAVTDDAVSDDAAPGGGRMPLSLRRFGRCWSALGYDQAVLAAGGRWPDRLAPMPSVLPGDAVALRACGVEQQMSRWDCWSEEMNAASAFEGREPMADQMVDMYLSAALLAQAVPFFLPTSVAAGVAGSLPPDRDTLAELVLPHPVCLLTLGAPMLLAPRSAHWPDHLLPDLAAWNDAASDADVSLTQLREHDRPGAGAAVLGRRASDAAGGPAAAVPRSAALRRGRTASCADVVTVTRMPLLAALWRFGALVDGVVLMSAESGRGVRDECLWLLRVPDPADATRSIGRAVLPGQISGSAFAEPVANLTTALAVSDWHVPGDDEPPLPRDPGSSAFRKATRKAAFAEAEAAGAVGGVRVLTLPPVPAEDAAPSQQPTEPGDEHPSDSDDAEADHDADAEAEERRRLRTHLRRGHWRRSRVGPKDDWSYRSVLILPTVVNADDQSWRGVAVYRLPEPGTQGPT